MTSSTIVLGGRSPVADQVLDHHRANFRPRVAVTVPPLPAPEPLLPAAKPVAVRLSLRASVSQVVIIRLVACLMLWGIAGTIYGFWQLGNALVPLHQHGVVTCASPRGVGSIPGC